MAVRVGNIREEYNYLDRNPHRCDRSNKGAWEPIKQSLNRSGIEQLTVRCVECGHIKIIKFDVTNTFPPRISRIMKLIQKHNSNEE